MKKMFQSLLFVLFILLISACGGIKIQSEADVKADFRGAIATMIGHGETIDAIDLQNRETNKEDNIDVFWFRVESKDSDVAYIRYYQAIFRYYNTEDLKGWILDDVYPDKNELWSIAPVAGAKNDLINYSVMGLEIIIDDDEWFINEQTVGNIEIINRDTQLNLKKDTVIVSVEILSDVLIAKGEIKLDFIFNNGWFINDVRVTTFFTTSRIEGTGLNISDDELASIFSKDKMVFGKYEITETDKLTKDIISTVGSMYDKTIGNLLAQIFIADLGNDFEQTFDISPIEISNIIVNEIISTDKGRREIHKFTFMLDKYPIVFEVNGATVFAYDKMSGWIANETVLIPKVKSFDYDFMIGRWIGQVNEFNSPISHANNTKLQFIMDISEINSDGTMTVLIDYPSEVYSCKATGYIDIHNLTITITHQEWFNLPRPRHRPDQIINRMYEPNLYGMLEIESKSLVNIFRNDYRWFHVAKSE